MKIIGIVLIVWGGGLLLACSSMSLNANSGPRLYRNTPWVLLPSINNTEAPQAGGRLDSIAATLMRTHGINISIYSVSSQQDDGMFESADRRAQEAALTWARQQGFRYALAGSVDEWHYKAGLDGEPAVGVSLSILDVANGQAIWSGSVAGTGDSREAISALAQDLVNSLLNEALSEAADLPKAQVAGASR